LTAVALNNHAANRKTQPYAMRLRREKRIKDVAQLMRVDPRPRIFDRDHYSIAIVEPRSHPEHPISIRGFHCLNRVLHQIGNDLLQLSPVAGNKRQLYCKFGASGHAVFGQLSARGLQYFECNFVDIDRLPFVILSSKQGEYAIEHFASATAVIYDAGDRFPGNGLADKRAT
jgi:hypothetical protein